MVDFHNPFYYVGMLLAFIICYLIGSLNWSIIISKLFYHTDIRKYYSHNAGATNVRRKLGAKVAILVLILDAAKVWIGMLCCFLLSLINVFSQISYYIPVIFVALGHTFPVYFRFKGGKCVSIILGFSIIINPVYFIILFAIYWILLLSTKYISIASVFSLLILGIVIWIPYLSGLNNFINNASQLAHNPLLYFNLLHSFTPLHNGLHYYDNLLTINLSLEFVIIFAIILHHKNIKKLINKEEYKFYIHKNKVTKGNSKEIVSE